MYISEAQHSDSGCRVAWLYPIHKACIHTYTSRNATTESLCAKRMSWLVMVTEDEQVKHKWDQGTSSSSSQDRKAASDTNHFWSAPLQLSCYAENLGCHGEDLVGLLPWILRESLFFSDSWPIFIFQWLWLMTFSYTTLRLIMKHELYTLCNLLHFWDLQRSQGEFFFLAFSELELKSSLVL